LKKKNKQERNQQYKNITWELQNWRKNHGRCQNRQQKNIQYAKIVTTDKLHSQPPMTPSTLTLSKVNISTTSHNTLNKSIREKITQI
jgi:hypothetical protein